MRWAAGLDPDRLPGREASSVLWSRAGLSVHRLQARYEPYPWSAPMVTVGWGVALARCGAYARRAGGVEQLVDVNTGFFRRPGDEVAVSAFTSDPEDLTILNVAPEALDDVPGLTAASGPLRVTPAVDLAHRLLRGAVRDGVDDLAVQAAIVDLLQASLADGGHGPRGYSRKSTETARHRLVRDACELLYTADHQMELMELARAVGSSPFHLSRVFHEITGMTLSQYRLRLRVHAALDRIAAGDDDLASIAAAAGFADHSHLTRTVVTQFGEPPSALRKMLRDGSTRSA